MSENLTDCLKCGARNKYGHACSCRWPCAACGRPADVCRADTSCRAAPPATKETNPKDAIGSSKVPFDLVPDQVVGEVALALLEGAAKYGASNWRVAGVRASIYLSAARRHLSAFREGQDIDPASGLSHVTKAIAGLVVLRDSMLQGNWVDDRPPRARRLEWVDELNKLGAEILARHPNPRAAFTQSQFDADNVPDGTPGRDLEAYKERP